VFSFLAFKISQQAAAAAVRCGAGLLVVQVAAVSVDTLYEDSLCATWCSVVVQGRVWLQGRQLHVPGVWRIGGVEVLCVQQQLMS
jgi:hypothetical protein